MTKKVTCPKCYFEWDVDDDQCEKGDLLTCDDCQAQLEVVKVLKTKIECQEAGEVDEDWGE